MTIQVTRFMLVVSVLLVTASIGAEAYQTNQQQRPSPSVTKVENTIDKAARAFSISDIALIAQAIVLFGTLVVLIWQTRHANKVSRMAQYLSALQMMSENRAQLMSKGSLINPEQESDFFRQMYALVGKEGYYYKLRLLHTFELFFLLHESHLIDKEMWLGWRNNIRICFEADINRRIWIAIRNQDLFHPHFKTFIDTLVEPASKSIRQFGETPVGIPAVPLEIGRLDAKRRALRFVMGETALAAIGEEDWVYFYEWLNNEEMVTSMRDLDPLPIGGDDAKRYIASHRKDTWLILARERDGWVPIGYIWLIIRQRHQIGRLFIAIGEPGYLRLGHARRASEMMVSWAFDDCNLKTIHLSVSANNTRAIKLYRNMGFSECGRYHDARFEHGRRYDEILMELKKEMWHRRQRKANE